MEMTAAELAARLSVTRRHATELLAAGAIDGRQLANGTWVADSDSVVRYETAFRVGKGRQLDPGTAWGLLWELSGLNADWLSARTRARVRARIRNSSADQLARAVAGRAKAHRYRAANSAKAAAGLITTGRAAAGSLDVGLMDDTRQVYAYARRGSAQAHAEKHFMVATPGGNDVVYDNTLPIEFTGDVMPAAVIAADLAVSTDTRERSGGLRALEQLRQVWLATT
jgi:hypothetical protein